MELKDLIGKHVLTGVDLSNGEIESQWSTGGTYSGESISFCLDGVTYTAREDENDGYRSSMRDLVVSSIPLSNTFAGEEVVGSMKEPLPGSYFTSCEILELISTVTGKTVLAVGTDNDDDYYPSFVAYFEPKNLSANAA